MLNYKELSKKVLVIIFGFAAFLRFYRLPEFMTYLGDQGRDAIIIKRILTFEHFPAIGPSTSYGQVFLGPFYYYFVAPWLGLFQFNPAGLGYGVAFFSVLYVITNYVIVKDLFGKSAALISTILLAFSITMIEASRFSWNPNLLPFTTLLTFYSVIKAIQTRKRLFFILSGVFLSMCIQLHYLSLFFIPGIVLYFCFALFQARKNVFELLKKCLLFIVSFVVFSSPLIVFDLRHQFLNSRNFIKLLTQSSQAHANKFEILLGTFHDLNRFTFNLELMSAITTLLFFGLLYVLYNELKKKSLYGVLISIFIVNLLAFTYYSGPRFPHYFGTLLPLYFIIVGIVVSKIQKLFNKKVGYLIVTMILILFVIANAQKYYFIAGSASNQVNTAKQVAQKIYDAIGNNNYRLTALPERYSDTTYRYFLEIWGKRAIEKDSIDQTSKLVVVCDRPCKPIGDPQFDVALFAPTQVDKQIMINSTTIYILSK